MSTLRDEAIKSSLDVIDALTKAYANVKNIDKIQENNLTNYLSDAIVVKDILTAVTVPDSQVYAITEIYTNALCAAPDYILNGVLTDDDYKLFKSKLGDMVAKINTIELLCRK